ncbi:MotB family protein [Oryzifoliimicrobium ureilyticus]|uniref:MotB family protein n=1 Tax=Oryzifoliimicrobium ureilyticus TaxID=3113724 RepID=UPI0030763392
MSESENHHHGKNEVIIVKKHGGGDHDGAHGGAWKIAYADFMTAMMAFFLVMWLVNAANEETKASVASYFNPIKLADEKPTQKGLKKPVEQADGEQKEAKSKNKEENPNDGSSAASGDDQTSTSGDQTRYSEADFFENPYSVLAEIAQEVGTQANVSSKGEGGASTSGPATGADGGQAYRDPFDPDFWTKQVEVTQANKNTASSDQKSQQNAANGLAEVAAVQPADAKKQFAAAADETDQPSDVKSPTDKQSGKASSSKLTDKSVDAKDKPDTSDKSADAQKQADDLRKEIEAQLSGVGGKLVEGLTVTPTEGGLLVSISDQTNDAMFDVGSAVPRQEMVLAMQKIGAVLKEKTGAIFVRGHTDGRQYKGANENWRLSMNRAQAAYYMLVRGGLDEKRVMQVSGYADRMLKDTKDPLDPENRRIEILLQNEQG